MFPDNVSQPLKVRLSGLGGFFVLRVWGAGCDGAKMLAAINIHHDWMKKPGKKTLDEMKKEMRAAFKKSAYETAQINALVDRIIEVYNPKTIPAADAAVLGICGLEGSATNGPTTLAAKEIPSL